MSRPTNRSRCVSPWSYRCQGEHRATEEEFEAEIKRIADAYQMEADKVKSLVDAAAVKKDLAVNKAIDFVKSKANIVAGAAEEKKPAKKTTRKTTKKAAAKKDEEPKEEENKGE